MLTNAEALSISSLHTIVVDASHIDQKQRGIMDMKEIHVPLVRLLNHVEIRNMYGDVLKLLFF